MLAPAPVVCFFTVPCCALRAELLLGAAAGLVLLLPLLLPLSLLPSLPLPRAPSFRLPRGVRFVFVALVPGLDILACPLMPVVLADVLRARLRNVVYVGER